MPAPPAPAGIAPETFREACAQHAAGVTVVTVRADDGTPHGLTISSFTPVSLNPPLILVCIDYACTILSHFRGATHFAVNVLNAGQQAYSITFSEKPEGRFDGIDWFPGATAVPLLPGALAWFECEVAQVVEAGDHAILIGRVIYAEAQPGEPLVYFQRGYHRLL